MPWIIDRDLLGKGPRGTNENAVGISSASWDDDYHAALARYQFRMKDGDGVVYYMGRSTVNHSFAPLDDFGAPNAGCTTIEYLNRKVQWEVL